MVLVEPAFEGDEERVADAAAPALAQLSVAQAKQGQACAAIAEHEGLKVGTQMADNCATHADPEMPDELNALLFQQSLQPGWWKDYVSENSADLTTQMQVLFGQLSLTTSLSSLSQRSVFGFPRFAISRRSSVMTSIDLNP